MRGADALNARLSTLLQKAIVRQIPAIQEKIQEAEDECEADLKSLGKVLVDPKQMAAEIGRLFGLSNILTHEAVHGTNRNPAKVDFFKDERDPKGTPAHHLRARVVEESER